MGNNIKRLSARYMFLTSNFMVFFALLGCPNDTSSEETTTSSGAATEPVYTGNVGGGGSSASNENTADTYKAATLVKTDKDLPKCNRSTRDQLFYVKDQGVFVVCDFSKEDKEYSFNEIDLRGVAGVDGKDGRDGADGKDGLNGAKGDPGGQSLIDMSEIYSGHAVCPLGGLRFVTYVDNAPKNGSYDQGEEYGQTVYSCKEIRANKVVKIYASIQAFHAVREDGSIVAWGSSFGDGQVVYPGNSRVVDIVSSGSAYAGLRDDGSVLIWGPYDCCWGEYNYPDADALSSDVTAIFPQKPWGNTFAALKKNGGVVTWGQTIYGGDQVVWERNVNDLYKLEKIKDVSGQLTSGVKKIFSNGHAFAALKNNGSVVAWGDISNGGDTCIRRYDSTSKIYSCEDVSDKLSSGVVDIVSNGSVFAALKKNGSVVTWGAETSGADMKVRMNHNNENQSQDISESLQSGVVKLYSNGPAFAALKNDGSVVTWGSGIYGGDKKSWEYDSGYKKLLDQSEQLNSGVISISSNRYSFAALEQDGNVVTWGIGAVGGYLGIWAAKYHYWDPWMDGYNGLLEKDSSDLNIDNISSIVSVNEYSYAALKEDGSLVSWGFKEGGGDSSRVSSSLQGDIKSVTSTQYSFAALKNDGSVISWGLQYYGGNDLFFDYRLRSGVTDIYATDYAFAALKDDGTVVSWGQSGSGGDSSGLSE